jgi:hypothetical protein
MTIFDWIVGGAAVGLCIATAVMMAMALKIIYKMTAAGPETEMKEAESEAPPTKGRRIGIYVAPVRDRFKVANALAYRLCAIHAWQNENVTLTKTRQTKDEIFYEFSDGLRIETLSASESCRGRRFDYLYIDKAISDRIIVEVLLPQIIVTFDNIDASGEWKTVVNDGWEFFDANSVEQNKKEWRNGEWK